MGVAGKHDKFIDHIQTNGVVLGAENDPQVVFEAMKLFLLLKPYSMHSRP